MTGDLRDLDDGGARRLELRAGLCVALGALVAYATALTGDFVYDDIHSVQANPGVQTLGNLLRYFVDPSLFSSQGAEMYRPVLLCSFAVDWALGGGAALSFKLTSILLHATATWLVFRLARGLGVGLGAAALAAAWFGVHPLASATVDMVSSRSEGLCVVGALVALVAHQRAIAATAPRERALAVTVAALGVVVACGSKETGVVVPALMAAQEWLLRPAGSSWREVLVGAGRRLWPAVGLVLLYLLTRKLLLGQATATLIGRDGSDPMYGHTRDLVTQLATMGAALPGVFGKLIVPVGLTPDPHVDYHRSFLALPVLLGWTVVLGGSALLIRHGRGRPAAGLGVAMTWAFALPWIVLPLNVPIAEHRCYGCLAGFAVVVAALLDRPPVPAWDATRARRWLGVAAVPLLGLASMTAVRNLDYRDEAVLWERALAQDPRSFRAHWNLGTVWLRRGDNRRAEALLAQAVALYPGFRAARRAWIEAMLRLPGEEGWPYRAMAAAEELTRQKDDDPYYRLLHANTMLAVGRLDGDREVLLAAEARALSCHDIAARRATVFRLAAECRQLMGEPAAALAHIDAAIAAGFDQPAVRAQRSEVLRALGDVAAADRDLRAAWAQAPHDPMVQWVMRRRQAQQQTQQHAPASPR